MTRKTIDRRPGQAAVRVHAEPAEQLVPAQQDPGNCDCRGGFSNGCAPVGLERRRVGSGARAGMSDGRWDRVVPTRVQGWQRSSRRTASQPPRTAPNRSTAVTAYALHDGVNRQAGGSTGLIHRRYARITRSRIHASVDRPAPPGHQVTHRVVDRQQQHDGDQRPVTCQAVIGSPPVPAAAWSAPRPDPARGAAERPAAGGSARTTRIEPAGSRSSRSRTRWRSRRTVRCRTTELPTALPTTKPTRAVGAAHPGQVRRTGSARPGCRDRLAATADGAVKSSRRVSRAGGREARASPAAVRPRARRGPCAAGGEDGAAGTGAHAQPEAVGLGAPAVVRLEGALAHGTGSGWRIGRRGLAGSDDERASYRRRRTGRRRCAADGLTTSPTVRNGGRRGQTGASRAEVRPFARLIRGRSCRALSPCPVRRLPPDR